MSRSSSGVVGLLAEPERLRVVSALALGASTIPEVAAAAGMEPRAVVRALRRLERGGLVSRSKDELTLHADRFKDAARQAAPDEPGEPLSADPATDAVLRAFTRDGRIVSFPVQRSRRRLLLEHVAAVFEPGLRYPEKEVNATLRAWYADYAALRRYLVDEALLDRADGLYWRIGGPVPVDVPADEALVEEARVEEAPVEEARVEEVPVEEVPVERFQRVAAYGIARDGDTVLLSRLSRSVHKGRWTLPGGGLDFGERPVDAVVREVHEETGLHVRVEELLDADAELWDFVRDGVRREAHSIRFVYRVTVLGGTLGVVEVDGSTEAAAWWPVSDLPPLTPMAERMLGTGRVNP